MRATTGATKQYRTLTDFAHEESGIEYIGFTIYSLPVDVNERIDYLQMIAEDIVGKVR